MLGSRFFGRVCVPYDIGVECSQVCTPDGACRPARVSELFEYDNFIRVPAEVVEAGDICALSGISDVLVCSILICQLKLVLLESNGHFDFIIFAIWTSQYWRSEIGNPSHLKLRIGHSRKFPGVLICKLGFHVQCGRVAYITTVRAAKSEELLGVLTY